MIKKVMVVIILILALSSMVVVYTTFKRDNCWEVYPSGHESSSIVLCPEGE